MKDIRTRIKDLALAAKGNPRFSVRENADTIHIQMDGWDVASLDEGGVAYNNARLLEAEALVAAAPKP